jgi:GlpG protein
LLFSIGNWFNFSGSRAMRMIGHLKNEASARTFSGFLVSKDIRNLVEPDAEGWAVWIHSEDQIEAGQEALTAYVQNPTDPKYQAGSETAETIERQRRRDEAKAAKRIRTRDQIWVRSGLAPLTLSLIVISVAVTLVIGLDPNFHDMRWFAISLNFFDIRLLLNGVQGQEFLPQVQAGQVWRLITPIFVHFGPLHLLFNMIWLRDLGTMIEVRQGMLKLALLVVVVGILSNVAQYAYAGPYFGGMSGVLYGLFGYIWLRGQCDPASGLALSQSIVWMMMIWFFLCLSGLLGNVANGTHAVGLLVGVIWGAVPMARKFFHR